MKKEIDIKSFKFRSNLAKIMDDVEENEQPYLLYRYEDPVLAVIPAHWYAEYKRMKLDQERQIRGEYTPLELEKMKRNEVLVKNAETTVTTEEVVVKEEPKVEEVKQECNDSATVQPPPVTEPTPEPPKKKGLFVG